MVFLSYLLHSYQNNFFWASFGFLRFCYFAFKALDLIAREKCSLGTVADNPRYEVVADSSLGPRALFTCINGIEENFQERKFF